MVRDYDYDDSDVRAWEVDELRLTRTTPASGKVVGLAVG
jgi:hypothetical protein